MGLVLSVLLIMTKPHKNQLSFFSPIEQKVKVQERANKLPIILRNLKNIEETLPALLPHQHLNVLKAENRYFTDAETQLDGINKAMMFTDNTGSGKTFTGLGISNRFDRIGKKDILVLVPSEPMCRVWMNDAKHLGFPLYQLTSTKDAGRLSTAVVTTYANFRQNTALQQRAAMRPFALIVCDESHNLVSNIVGKATSALDAFHVISNVDNIAFEKARKKFKAQVEADMEENRRVSEETKEKIDVERRRLINETKVLYLSATPFSYHKNLIYGDGYLFRITQGVAENLRETAYNKFFIENFQYSIKYNKLTIPDEKTDVGKLERDFHSRLVKAGCVSSTRLKLDKDYSREFVMLDDELGAMIDEGYERATNTQEFKKLPAVCERRFDYMYETQLMECIKARLVIPRIEQHLAMGRKVVVFHNYNNSLPAHPFDFHDPSLWVQFGPSREALDEIELFNLRYPKFRALDLSGLLNPIETFTRAFGNRVAFFNGNVSKAERSIVKAQFNSDGSEKDIIVIQKDAGGSGISCHDTTGIHQRVEINIGLPIRPADAIQAEGRIYRIGQKSNAVVEYAVTHLNLEKMMFSVINTRASTAENLAFGEQARNLKDAFKEGYKNPIFDPPHAGQGIGSRDSDMLYDHIKPWEMAIRIWTLRQQRTQKLKDRDGAGYEATPEPIGMKIAEWLYPKPGDDLLEPSAGHGAIARYFPENTKNKFLEPSFALRADLSINATGKIEGITFEDHHTINKYDGIAMFPPGDAVMVMKHILQAISHIKACTRMIVVAPMDEHMDNILQRWQANSDHSKGCFITTRFLLPDLAYGRPMQILIIDHGRELGVENVDLRGVESHDKLWEVLKDMPAPVRNKSIADKFKPKPMYARVIVGKHTKLGHDIWTVDMMRPLTVEQFNKATKVATANYGYWSDYTKNGAIRGWVFKGIHGPENATKLVNYINNVLT